MLAHVASGVPAVAQKNEIEEKGPTPEEPESLGS